MRGTSAGVEQVARAMRREMTPAEKRLWAALSARKLDGLKFRAQHPVGRFVLDFYCAAAKLDIEIDGDIHDLTAEQDAARTAHLESYGYRVSRFRNETVFTDLSTVLSAIERAAHERIAERAAERTTAASQPQSPAPAASGHAYPPALPADRPAIAPPSIGGSGGPTPPNPAPSGAVLPPELGGRGGSLPPELGGWGGHPSHNRRGRRG